MDNLPVPYLENFVQMSWQERNTVSKVAVVIDVRSRKNLAKLEGILGSLREKGYEVVAASVRFVVAWKAKDAQPDEPESAIILPDLKLRRIEQQNST